MYTTTDFDLVTNEMLLSLLGEPIIIEIHDRPLPTDEDQTPQFLVTNGGVLECFTLNPDGVFSLSMRNGGNSLSFNFDLDQHQATVYHKDGLF